MMYLLKDIEEVRPTTLNATRIIIEGSNAPLGRLFQENLWEPPSAIEGQAAVGALLACPCQRQLCLSVNLHVQRDACVHV